MGMDAGQIRDFIREWIDVDETDLPDSVLNPILDDATVRIAMAGPRWPWLRHRWTLTVPPSILGVQITDPAPEEIMVVAPESGGAALRFIDYFTAVREPNALGGDRRWSLVDDVLHVWPTPSASMTVVADGYRAMNTNWTGTGLSGAEPDMPAQHHDLIRMFALAGAYMQQDDPEMATEWQQRFEMALAERSSQELRAPAAQPLVLNGGGTSSTGGSSGPRYPFQLTN